MPPVPPERRDDGSAPPNDEARVPCTYCFGMSVYTRAMWQARQSPECKGVQVDFSSSRERMQELRSRAPHPRQDDFSFMGIGLSIYSKDWMGEGKHMPYVRGLGVIAVHTDTDDLMKQIEERKRIKRELRKNIGSKGDLQDGDDDVVDDDDDDIFDYDDTDTSDDGQALVENEVVPPMNKPRNPTVIDAGLTMQEIRDRAVERTKHSVNAMYKFWERRLDGFSDRYMDSCKRLTEQMQKQVISTPHNVMWLVHRIEEYVSGKDDGKK